MEGTCVEERHVVCTGGYENTLERHHVIGKAYLNSRHNHMVVEKGTKSRDASWEGKLLGTKPNGRQHVAQARDPYGALK